MGDLRTESWRQAFEQQATQESLAQVFAFASMHGAMIETATRCHDPLIARELALDAMADTFAGKVKWDPEKAPLVAHLCRVIRSRTSHELKRAKRFAHLSLERDHSIRLEEATSNALALATDDDERTALVERARVSLDAMRAAAIRDPDVLRLLDAFSEGVTERSAVMSLTGLSCSEYENTVRRMRRLAKSLPAKRSKSLAVGD